MMSLAKETVLCKIPKEAIQRIGKDKFAEIAIRETNGTFSSMVKCALESPEKKKVLSGILKQLPKGPLDGVSAVSSLANNVQTEMVRKEVKKVGKDVREALDLTKNLSVQVDKLAQGMSVVQSLSILNVALAGVNTGISLVGFSIMNKKLETLHQELDVLHRELDAVFQAVCGLKDMKLTELVNEGRSIRDDSQGLYQHIERETDDLAEYERLLGRYRDYMRNLRDYMLRGLLDYEQGYRILMGLFPEYTAILKRYVEKATYEEEKFPQLIYATHLRVIGSLADGEFQERLFDFAYLERNLSKRKAEEAQTLHFLAVGNGYAVLEDARELVTSLTENEYAAFRREIAAESRRRLTSAILAAPEACDREEMLLSLKALEIG